MSLPPIRSHQASEGAGALVGGRAAQLGSDKAETEPFGDLLSAMLNTGVSDGFLGDGEASRGEEHPLARPQVAEMFNEHGLFRGEAALHAAAPDDVGRREASGVADDRHSAEPTAVTGAVAEAAPADSAQPTPTAISDASEPSSVSLSGGETRALGRAEAGPRLAAGAALSDHRAARAAIVSPALSGRPQQATPQSAAHRETPGPGGAASRIRAARLVQDLLNAGSTANAQVTVQAAEQGISLSARAEKLSREERNRLRAEIAELLARHGFVARQISLNGEADPRQRS